ncbi:MAG: pectinesterase family protein [Phycisphaerales bacterium]|nr:pectinesterase family protein [Phycisphaerales bacterium]
MNTLLGNAIWAMSLMGVVGLSDADIVVDASGDGDYLTIQEAIDAASEGEIIQVRSGVYTGAGEFIAVCEDKLLSIIGAGAEQTIIDGEGERAGFSFSSTNSGDLTSLIEGVTVRNCVQQSGMGGGLRIIGPMVVRSCTFEDNGTFDLRAGAISVGSGTLIESCTFRNNIGISSGAVYARNATIRDCTFEANQADYTGGAIWSSGFSPPGPMTVENCIFRLNTAGTDGGAVRVCCGASMQMTGCTFEFNSCESTGGAVYFQSDASLGCAISDTLIKNCNADDSGGGVYSGIEIQLDGLDVSFCDAPLGAALHINVPYASTPSALSNTNVWKCGSNIDGVVYVEYDDDVLSGLVVSDSVFCANSIEDITGAWSDGGGNEWTGPECPWECDADLNGDFVVDVDDVLLVIARYGSTGADPNGDGVVDVNDILLVIDQWGPC